MQREGSSSTAAPAVSITVVTYNSASCVGEALRSVRSDVQSGFAQLIVVDNASPDDSVEVVKEAAPEATIIRSDTNLYFAGGCNLAWPQVRGRYWLLLNPDVVVPPGGLRELISWMDAHPELGAGTPSLVDREGTRQTSAWRFPTVRRALVELLRLHLLMSDERRQDFLLGPYWRGGEHLDIDWALGAAVIARRETVERVGLLSESLPMYGEDSEWGWRMRRAGIRIGLMDGTPWIHDGLQSSSRTWTNQERLVRTWQGMYSSARMRGNRVYASLLWLTNLASFLVEGIHPRRSAQSRRHAWAVLRAHLQILLRRARRGPGVPSAQRLSR